jgi:hypothetical protein
MDAQFVKCVYGKVLLLSVRQPIWYLCLKRERHCLIITRRYSYESQSLFWVLDGDHSLQLCKVLQAETLLWAGHLNEEMQRIRNDLSFDIGNMNISPCYGERDLLNGDTYSVLY